MQLCPTGLSGSFVCRGREVSRASFSCALAAIVTLACSDQPSVGPNGSGGSGGQSTAGASGSAGAAGATAAGGSGGSNGSGGAAGVGQGGNAGNAGNAGAAGSAGAAGNAGAAGSGNIPTGALCPDGALFCEDFEEGHSVGQFPASPWEDGTNSGGVVSVDATRAFSGSNAALATAPGNASYRRAYMALRSASGAFPAAAQEMYGRAMMWLESVPNEVHWTFVQGEGRAADDTHNALYRYGGQHEDGLLMANYETTDGVATDCYDHSATVMPTGAWTCVEWRFAVATNEMQFWLNGSELADIHVTQQGEGCGGNALGGQWIAPPAFDTLYLGWEHYQQVGNDVRLWIDDVAVGTERMACPAAP